MGKKIYVGNLSFTTTEQELSAQFSAHGQVDSAKVIMDHMTGRSKGFAFVEMSTDSEARAAISGLNGFELNGRALKVNEAKPMEDKRRDRY